MPCNKVFIATSLDGYIADEEGKIDWLHSIPNPDGIDMGYSEFMESVDAILMGRNTFETVLGFDIEWPYNKPVYVLSNTLNCLPEKNKHSISIVSGSLTEVLKRIHRNGHKNLYIDGGQTIQSFFNEDLIDEITITIIPIILGGGIPLFGEIANKTWFKCVETNIYLDRVVQNRYKKETI